MNINHEEQIVQKTLDLAHAAEIACCEEGIKTTIIVVVKNSQGEDVANVYHNGILQEVPMSMMMIAMEASDSVQEFARRVHTCGTIPTSY